MSSAHLIYIPLILLAGFIGGVALGQYIGKQGSLEADNRLKQRERVAQLRESLSGAQGAGKEEQDNE